MFKKIFFIIIITFLSQCGYTALYKNNSNENIEILVLSLDGDKVINNKINTELRKYYNNQSDNKFEIKINSNFDKLIIAKDSTGKASDYKLSVTATFDVNFKNINQKFSFEESLKIKNTNDSFEQKKYENVIKSNFAKSIRDKLILKLQTL